MACFPSFFIFLFSIILGWHRVVCQQLYNITVDDSDAAITYMGNWQQSAYSQLDQGGKHMIAVHPNASAVFIFRGVAVFFLSPLWPYDVTTQVQLDSRPPEILNLRDVNSPEATDGGPETAGSRIIWGIEGLDDQPHQLKISVAPGHQWAIVDGLIVTAANQTATVTTSTTSVVTTRSDVANTASTTTLTASVPPSSAKSSGKSFVPIGVGIGLGALALLVASVVLHKFCRRRRTIHNSSGTLQLDLEKDFPPTIRPPPRCETPSPAASNPETSVAGEVLVLAPIQPELKDFSTSLPKYDSLLPPSSPSSMHYIERALRRITFNRPPPAYHECTNSSRRETYRMSQLPRPGASSGTKR